MKRTVFFVSDHTAITAETFGRSLLSQFETVAFERVAQPFVDCEAKAMNTCRRSADAFARDGQAPLVFSTLTDEHLRQILERSEAVVFDLFEAFLDRMETTLGQSSAQAIGRAHGLGNAALGRGRVEALRNEIRAADALFGSAGIPYLDTSTMSVEEIAANILHRSGLKRVRW